MEPPAKDWENRGQREGTAFKIAFPVTDETHSNMDWVPETLDFTATGTTTLLQFVSTTN